MKLSILIYNNKPSSLEKLLNSIFLDYNARDTEVLVIVDGKTNIDELMIKFESKIHEQTLKFIFTSAERRLESYWAALEFVRGEYVMFLTSASQVKNKTIEKLVISLETMSPDILEFDIQLEGTVHLKYKPQDDQILRNMTYDAQKTKKLYAYTSPFIVNKILKTSFINRIRTLEGFQVGHVSVTYELLNHAKTYIYVENPGLTLQLLDKPDIIGDMKQWDYLLKTMMRYSEWDLYKDSIEYAYIWYMVTYLGSILKAEKLTEDELRWKMLIQERVMKLFPNWRQNSMIITDENLLKSALLKSLEQGKEKVQEGKINPLKKHIIKSNRAIKRIIKK